MVGELGAVVLPLCDGLEVGGKGALKSNMLRTGPCLMGLAGGLVEVVVGSSSMSSMLRTGERGVAYGLAERRSPSVGAVVPRFLFSSRARTSILSISNMASMLIGRLGPLAGGLDESFMGYMMKRPPTTSIGGYLVVGLVCSLVSVWLNVDWGWVVNCQGFGTSEDTFDDDVFD